MAFLVRSLVLSRFAGSPHFWPATDDMRFYAEWATRISQGQLTDGQAFYGLPGYAFCIAGIYSLFGVSPLAAGLIQAIFEAITSVLIFKIAKLSFPKLRIRGNFPLGPVIGGIAAMGWILYLPAQTFSAILMPSAWLLAAFWGCVWWMVKGRTPIPPWTWLLLGTFLGAVATIVATILFLVPLFIVAALLRAADAAPISKRITSTITAIVLLCGGVLAGTSPAWLHNYFVARDPVLLSAHGGLNFWMGNNPDATGYPKIPDGLSAGQEGLLRDSITRAEEVAGRKLKRSEVSKFWSDKANAWVRENRGAWLRLLGVKLRNFWNAFQYDDLSEITLLREEGILTHGLRFGVVAAFGLPGLFIAAWRFPRARWVAAAVLLHMCALMPVFITERYRLCAVPGLMIFAAFAVVEIWRVSIEARWISLAGWLGALGISTAFVSWPQREPGLWALDPFNTGLKTMRAGNLELAQTKLETAHRFVPDNSEVNFGLGNLWYQKDDLDRARQFYRRTIDLNPKHAGAWMNLGRVETRARQFPLAEKCLRTALSIEPESARAHFFLAEFGLESGDFTTARAAIGRALELRPGQPELLELQKKIEAAPAP